MRLHLLVLSVIVVSLLVSDNAHANSHDDSKTRALRETPINGLVTNQLAVSRNLTPAKFITNSEERHSSEKKSRRLQIYFHSPYYGIHPVDYHYVGSYESGVTTICSIVLFVMVFGCLYKIFSQ
ncbi:RxLR-like protein [Plasmopara halstedii]|uniref:Secreted RxLR effector protein RXLR-C21 n=1 Tax=Plasmopara halstedii TaxID=4781 RepID=RLR21_PLAHL|nr:RxLR-like protein [Plasmopara halstedii]A0A0P1ATX0.1 RecName: Full=Secreted RxLR effector protein RXLR-C21; Flags: Precursor [Plasmopara halstedii]CEG45727.1 RxLR-like protein [Plasmopara halstedii]|eukprot:XP_024582096.1 RxLR-like protein [Plasmopara halstedii]